jgi:hypothetical protein
MTTTAIMGTIHAKGHSIRSQDERYPLHQSARALADGDHRGDGGNANDHAQHREAGPHAVFGQGSHRDPQGDEEIHVRAPSAWV